MTSTCANTTAAAIRATTERVVNNAYVKNSACPEMNGIGKIERDSARIKIGKSIIPIVRGRRCQCSARSKRNATNGTAIGTK